MHSIICLKNYFKLNCVDIFHAHDYKSRFIGYWAAKLAKVRTVTTVHGWIQNTPKDKAYVALDKLMLRLYSRIVVVSKDLRKKVLKLGIPSERILLLHNAVPEPSTKGTSDSSLRKELGFGDNEKIIASIGRLSKEKGVDDLLVAVRAILGKFPDARFLIIGEGPEEPLLEARTKKLGLESVVYFLGFRDDLNMVYPAIDLVVLSSYTEGLPKVLLEALSYGKPVVATSVGGVPEIIIHEKTGLVVPPHSPALLSNAICDILSCPPKGDLYGEAGRSLIRSDFSLRSRTLKLEQLYEQAVNTKWNLSHH
jgi:glycosyltransferase involved in cell wall biosynthesis